MIQTKQITPAKKEAAIRRKKLTAVKNMLKDVLEQKWRLKSDIQTEIFYKNINDVIERIAWVKPYIYNRATEDEIYLRGKIIAASPDLLNGIINQIKFLKLHIKKITSSNFITAKDFEKNEEVIIQNKAFKKQITRLENILLSL